MKSFFLHILVGLALGGTAACGAVGGGASSVTGQRNANLPAGGAVGQAAPVQDPGVAGPDASIGEFEYVGLLREQVAAEASLQNSQGSDKSVTVNVKGSVLDCFGNAQGNLKGRAMRVLAHEQKQFIDVVIQDGNTFTFSWKVPDGSWEKGWSHYVLPAGYLPAAEGMTVACQGPEPYCFSPAQSFSEDLLLVNPESNPGTSCLTMKYRPITDVDPSGIYDDEIRDPNFKIFTDD